MDYARVGLRIVWGEDCPLLKLTVFKPYIDRVNCFDMLSENVG